MAIVINSSGVRQTDVALIPRRLALIKEQVDAALVGQETRLNPWVLIRFGRAVVYAFRDGTDYTVMHVAEGEQDFDTLVRA